MKKIVTSLVVLIFLLTAQAFANSNGGSDEPNIITNPGFEESIINATGWHFNSNNENNDDLISLDIVNDSYSGTQAAHISSTLSNSDNWSLWAPFKDADKLAVTPGDELEYSVMVKAISIGSLIQKSFVTYDANGDEIENDAAAMDITLVLDQYVKYTNKFIVPEGVAFVSPRLTGEGSCDITVDDFELTGIFHVSFSSMGPGSVITLDGYFDLGTRIKIEAAADAGNKFVGWIGDYVSGANPDSVTLTGDMHIIARFIDEDSELNHKYYVSTDGNNDNDGSIDHPWSSITYGSSQLYPDDTLIVKSGIYNIVRETISNSGGNGKYITILGEEGAIIEGSSTNSEYGIVTIEDANYVILDGITVINAKSHGIKVYGRCKHIILRNNRTEHTRGCGILVQGSRGYPWDNGYYVSDLLVEHNEIHWPQEGVWDGHLIYHEDITFMQGVEHFEIRHNYVNAYDSIQYHGGPIAIDVKDGVRYGIIHHNTVEDIPANGIYIDAWDTYAHHIDIYQNYIHNCTGQGIQIGAERGGPIDSVKVYNNIIYKIGWVGISSGDYNGGDGTLYNKTNVHLFNNTIINAGYRGWGNGIYTQSSFKNGKIYNNIIYDCKPNGMDLNRQDNNMVTNNCIYKSVGSDSGDEGENAVLEDPQFVDVAHANFYLKRTSPCIDVALAEGAPAFDYAGTARPIGAGFDIGAYEIEQADGVFNEALPIRNMNAYPNPFSDKISISYTVDQPTDVKLSVYDMYGKEIEILVNQKQLNNDYNIEWDGSAFPNGVYFINMQNDYQSISKKVILNR